MHTPTQKQMQVVIDNLKKVLPMTTAPGHLDMSEAEVNCYGHECGTVHCFGGWYAIAVCDPGTNELNFKDGKNAVARDLGFQNADQLLMWAMDNTYWGTHFGGRMFFDRYAFYNRKKRIFGAERLQDIVDHLEEVRDRLPL